MSWLSKFFGGSAKPAQVHPPAPETSQHQPAPTTYQQAIFEQASGLMHIINESLQISNNSTNPETKVSRLEVARSKLDSLELLSKQNPFLKLQRLEAVRQSMAVLSSEFSNAGYYALTDQSCRDYRQDVWRGINMPSNDLIKGCTFSATMSLDTPARVLIRHGEVHDGLSDPPQIAKEQWEGMWRPNLKSWKEITGIDIEDFKSSSMASDIGQIPPDGGEYLKFLLRVRGIVEGADSVKSRKRALSDELKNPEWSGFVRKLGGKQAIQNSFFPAFIEYIKGLSRETIEALWNAKLTTPASLSLSSDAALKAFKGIGPAKLKVIREACDLAVDPSCEFVDGVIR